MRSQLLLKTATILSSSSEVMLNSNSILLLCPNNGIKSNKLSFKTVFIFQNEIILYLETI